MTARDVLLVYFFTVIGINAQFSDLIRGGKPLGLLLAVTAAFMLAEILVGIGAARLLGLDASIGLLSASISMTWAATAPPLPGRRSLPIHAASPMRWRSACFARRWAFCLQVSPAAP